MLNIAGGLAIMAWLCVVNIGYLIARYYKPLWSGKKVLGADIWFLVNFVVYSRLFVILLIVDIIELHVYKHVQILMQPAIIFFRLKFQDFFRKQAIFYQHRIVQLMMHITICSRWSRYMVSGKFRSLFRIARQCWYYRVALKIKMFRCRRGRMVVGFITTYAMSAYHH